MNITKSELLTIAGGSSGYPEEGPPEIAFAGRSNAGKSTLLNLITGRKKLAHVSNTPGKTRTINFYSINDDAFRIVDLPGYGYAKVGKAVSAGWGDMIEEYLEGRKTLKTVALLADIRHKPSVQDVQMYEWLKNFGLSGLIIATKADKISRGQYEKNLNIIRTTLKTEPEAVLIPVSSLLRSGIKELLSELDKLV